MSQFGMTLAVKAKNIHGFKTFAENYIQEETGKVMTLDYGQVKVLYDNFAEHKEDVVADLLAFSMGLPFYKFLPGGID